MFLAIGQKAAPCQKRYDSSVCGEQLTRRGELLGLLQAGWSPPTVNAPGLPRATSGAVGIARTPTGKSILFGTCAPHQGASAVLPPDVLERLSVAALGMLRFHGSDLGDRKLHVAKFKHSKIAKCVFCSLTALLQSQILTGCSVKA